MTYETTPNRKTHVRLNPPETVLLEPILAQERTAFEVARGIASTVKNTWLKPETGWQLEPIQRRVWNLSEGSATAGSIYGSSQWTVAPGFVASPTFTQATDLTGVTYGPGVSTTGDLFYQKVVPAGQGWDAASFVLTADSASYPRPTSASEDVPMDRVAVGNTIPNAGASWFLRFQLPGAPLRSPDHIVTFYFPGPAMQGIGQWAIAFGGDGYADLYERNSDGSWTEIERLAYCPTHQVGSGPHLIHISPQSLVQNPKLSGVLCFEFSVAKAPAASVSAPGAFVPPGVETKQAVVPIPINGLTAQPCPVRLDVRRDLRLRFQVSGATYPVSGTIVDDPFSASFIPSAATPLLLAWSADIPAGCTLTGHLLDAATGVELASAGTVSGFPLYTPAPPNRYFVVKFLYSGSGSATPTLFSYRVQRDAVLGLNRAAEEALELSTVRLDVIGPDEDPSHETATLELEDALGGLTGLIGPGEWTVQAETEFDPLDATKRAVLFRGSIIRSERAPKLGGRTSYRLSAVGMWQRLAEALSPIRFNFGQDYASVGPNGLPLPFKVTDALRTLFALAGFGPAAVAIPDLPVRLFSTGDPDGLLLEPQAPLGDLIVRYARDYLGDLVLFDGNAGVWRLVARASSAGGTALAAFQSGPATVSGVSVYGPPHVLSGYPPATAFLRKGSHRTWVKPPEGNVVIAFGAANSGAGSGVPQLFKQVLVNPLSFDFGGAPTADLSSPDYLGRVRILYQFLPAQASAEAVSWVARRVYDAACHGRTLHSFQAPLLLVTDPGLTGMGVTDVRPLRVNDVVTVEGTACRLLNVNVGFRKDAHQYAFYEAEEL